MQLYFQYLFSRTLNEECINFIHLMLYINLLFDAFNRRRFKHFTFYMVVRNT